LGRVVAVRLSLAKPGEQQIPSWKINPNNIALPVIIELEQRQLLRKGGSVDFGNRANLQEAIQEGLRAQLSLESVLTGLLYVDLDFHPGTPFTRYEPVDSKIPEIPTRSTDFERFQRELMQTIGDLQKANVGGLIDSATRAMNAVATLASDPDVPKAVTSFNATLAEARTTLSQVRGTLANAQGAISDMRQLLTNAQNGLGPIQRRIGVTLDHVDQTLATANSTLEGIGTVVNPTAPPIVELNRTLVQVRQAAANLNDLSRMLDRNPSVLIRGRYIPAEDNRK
jgi:paraquat-inducible protein B